MNDRAQCLIVCGFLGSGKTTLVRRLLEEGQAAGIRTAVVSNEFGELGIDEALLASTGGDFVELAGGCVCCRLSDDLLLTLQQLWDKARPERVIVETSGLALPYDTLVNFWRDPVRAWATDESSVVVVSAEQLATGRDLDATFEDQVASADLLLLSKTDLVGEDEAAKAEETLRAMRPGTPLLRAIRGDVDPRVFFPPEPGTAPPRPSTTGAERIHDHATHSHDDYASEELAFAAGIDEAMLVATIEAKSALRAKGFVETSAGLRLVQGVAGRVELTPVEKAPRADLVGRVVVIERRAARAGHSSAQHSSSPDASAERSSSPDTPAQRSSSKGAPSSQAPSQHDSPRQDPPRGGHA